jgi:ferredoxin
VKIRADTSGCLGNGLCEAVAEDVFELGPDAVVHLLIDGGDDVPEARREAMRQAVEQCPTEPLSIHD